MLRVFPAVVCQTGSGGSLVKVVDRGRVLLLAGEDGSPFELGRPLRFVAPDHTSYELIPGFPPSRRLARDHISVESVQVEPKVAP